MYLATSERVGFGSARFFRSKRLEQFTPLAALRSSQDSWRNIGITVRRDNRHGVEDKGALRVRSSDALGLLVAGTVPIC